MNGYMLIWILLQKIEELQKELNTYNKNNTDKNWFISSGQFPTCPVFYAKKKICDSYFTYQVLLPWTVTSLKLLSV